MADKKKPTSINTNIEFLSFSEKASNERDYYCCSCGRKFVTQKNNFLVTRSPLFAGNNGFLPICKKCAVLYYKRLVEYFCGDEEKAVERMCQIFDWYYNEEVSGIDSRSNDDGAKVTAYPSKMSLRHVRGDTYLDTLRDRASIIKVDDEVEEVRFATGVQVPSETMQRFGAGYDPDTYMRLQELYDMFIGMIDNPTTYQQIVAKNAALLQSQLELDVKNGGKNVGTMSSTLSSLLNQNGFNTEKEASAYTKQIDMLARDIENYSPAEYFKDKKLYSDELSFTKYIQRFFERPLKNLFGKGRGEMDEEYHVTGEER